MSIVQPKPADPSNAGQSAAIPGSPPGAKHVETAEDARKAQEQAEGHTPEAAPSPAVQPIAVPVEPATSPSVAPQRGNRNG